MIETVAHQPWVLHHKVGMIGISYGGISQLFVAATDPPDLAAIAPLSVIDNTATTLYPGGILNTGFALPWAKDRDHDALAGLADEGPGVGAEAHPATATRPARPTRCCISEAVNCVAHGPRQQPLRAVGRRPAVADHVRAQDQGARRTWPASSPTSRPAATAPTSPSTSPAPRHKWFTFTNGVHADSLDPATFTRWYDFLELYVAHQRPSLSPGVKALAPTLYPTAHGRSTA